VKLSQLKIDPEFQSKIPPLQFEEEQQLEQNIIAEGRLLNPIITWNGYILDGHTRYRILKKHGFIKFEVEEIQLANKYEALAWICKNQLGRRNLSPERKKFLLGKEYESTKLAVGGQPGNCNKVNRCDQNDHIDSEKRTCERIAVEHGVGSATVWPYQRRRSNAVCDSDRQCYLPDGGRTPSCKSGGRKPGCTLLCGDYVECRCGICL